MGKKLKNHGKKPETVRNFAFIIYDDSANPAWKDILAEMHLKCVYIYHQYDKWPNGEPKKPHHHVMVLQRGTRSLESARKVVTELGGANGHVERIGNSGTYGRYMCHLDDKDKYQYNVDEVVEMGGADYKSIIGVSKKDKYETLEKIIELCNKRKYSNYCAIVDYCMKEQKGWVDMLLDIRFGRLVQDYIKCKSYLGDYEN